MIQLYCLLPGAAAHKISKINGLQQFLKFNLITCKHSTQMLQTKTT